ncbi:hypothetical protein [Amycolatopsis sp. VC5-11]|uniref:hypothetical protein n=1 Tax=Amycolatopsis sp. VC5-11 TaxID=3120156 RepID=UPI00300B3DD5
MRVEQHNRDAGRYGLTVVKTWMSDRVDDTRTQEARLLAVLERLGRRTHHGREYFTSVPFSIACYQAEHIDRVRRERCCCGKCVDPVCVIADATVVGLPVRTGTGPDGDFALMLGCGATVSASFSDPDLEAGGRYPLRVGDRLTVELETSGVGRWIAFPCGDPVSEPPLALGD